MFKNKITPTVPASGSPARRSSRGWAIAAATIASAALIGVGAPGEGAPVADAAGCFRTVTVSGQNAFGYAKAYSWNDWSAYVRTAPTASLCINYARAYGGYYFADVSCGQSSARLTSDSTSFRRGTNTFLHMTRTSVACASSATWQWHRTIASDQCVSLVAQSRWGINQANGTVTPIVHVPVHGYFRPASSC